MAGIMLDPIGKRQKWGARRKFELKRRAGRQNYLFGVMPSPTASPSNSLKSIAGSRSSPTARYPLCCVIQHVKTAMLFIVFAKICKVVRILRRPLISDGVEEVSWNIFWSTAVHVNQRKRSILEFWTFHILVPHARRFSRIIRGGTLGISTLHPTSEFLPGTQDAVPCVVDPVKGRSTPEFGLQHWIKKDQGIRWRECLGKVEVSEKPQLGRRNSATEDGEWKGSKNYGSSGFSYDV
ncbi:hypothetical protein B0H11DRAFT_1908060 [Mycena galericulata]|nr:hypothetical protein B0H11DRAFT_1908060 [Mycena galericulata]